MKELEEGWDGTKLIEFDKFEAHLNCYLDNGFYEVRYSLDKKNNKKKKNQDEKIGVSYKDIIKAKSPKVTHDNITGLQAS